ncbi:DUF4153 domain-containing protein [Pontibacter roseus]|uniref:DUF4153 domain-containing protein n=1 Tax=Pontibacter roseus TaxID=336989 RepID=UPI00037785B0|nr:DUF4153 domain-containing protein [Pontibacter roseus]
MAWLKNISLQQLYQGAAYTFLKYPLVLLSAFVGTWAAIAGVDVPYEQREQYTYLEKLVQVSALGLILFFVLELIGSRYRLSLLQRAVGWGAGIALLATYYFLLPPELQTKQHLRFFLLALTLHLVASYAMFFNRREENAFWQFNKALFLRILTSALYSAVLYLGLSLAVLAVENLFEVDVHYNFYQKLWFFMVGVFNTWFFLAGVPDDVAELEHTHTYPKGLKVFTQFVLLPLVTLYLVILYLYFGKIVLQWDWPQGWVSVLVLCFSIAGILSLLLIHPIRHTEGNTWIRTFGRWFFRALFPLIILLMLAIWRRVSEYGLTEERYFVVALALWLFCTALYFLFSRQKNIKFVPITLSLVALLSAVGPFSAFQVSERSQFNRLRIMLEQQGMLVDGKLIPATQDVADSVEQEVSSILHYLDAVHGLERVQPWFNLNLDSVLAQHQDTLKAQRIYDRNNIPVVMDLMGLEYGQRPYLGQDMLFFNTNAGQQQEVWHITGYDYLLNLHIGAEKVNRQEALQPNTYKIGSDSLQIRYLEPEAGQQETLLFVHAEDSLGLVLEPLFQELRQKGRQEMTGEEMTWTRSGEGFSLKLELQHVAIRREKGKYRLENISGRLLLKVED